MPVSDELIAQIGIMLAESTRPSVLSGAGISRESGIPTYRGEPDSYWSNPAVRRLATVAGFHETPADVWNFFQSLRQQMGSAQPNAGHIALAQLENDLPGLPVITQNVDDLYERAGSSKVVHLHGLINRNRCSRYCQGIPSLLDEQYLTHQESVPPLCPHCGAFVRPHVTFFGEYLHAEPIQMVEYIASQTDVMIVVGTSGVVAPASEIPHQAKNAGAKLIEINPEPTPLTPIADYWLAASTSDVLPRIAAACHNALI